MIKVKNVEFSYPNSEVKAVKSVNFEVAKGEVFGFLGPSGAGKSTMQKILTGLLKGYWGDVSVLGRNLKYWGSNLYEQIGVSFELPNHYGKLSGLENLKFFGSLYSTPTEDPFKLLETVGLGHDLHARVSSYSKGMKMRLNFIRALINKPEMLLLDEPTTGMDPLSARAIKDIILEKKREGKTIFLTTHDMATADELCDRVAFIVDGEIKLIESPSVLKANHGKKAIKVEYSNGNGSILTEFPLDKLGYNSDFLNLLRKNNIYAIRTLEATLEDVFVEVMGKGLN